MPSPALLIDALSFRHGESTVLKNLSLSLEPGRLHVIVGPNGSGKSTLLDLIAGYRQPETGTVTINGNPLNALSHADRAKSMSYMPQAGRTDFAYTVRESVMMGRHPHIPRFSSPTGSDGRMVDKALAQLELTKLAHRPITALSGGERQRTALARTLAQDAPLMLLDEPTSSMDPRHALDAMSILAGVCAQGKTVIAVLHDLNLAAGFADTITVLHQGGIAISGNVNKALAPQVITRVFGVEAMVDTDPFTHRPRIALRSRP